jgi:hypothetical protein
VLKPSEDSPEKPLGSMGQFEVRLPEGYELVPDDPNDSRWSRTFKILDSGHDIVARSGGEVEVFADIPSSGGVRPAWSWQPLDALSIWRVRQ